jgi:hypothetical protein
MSRCAPWAASRSCGSCLRRGWSNRFRLMIFPLLVGPSGREWAFEGVGESELALADVRVLDGRILLAEYAPTGRPIPSRP